MARMITEECATRPLSAKEYLLRRHTDACVDDDPRGGDPWNIYFRIGSINTWLYLTGADESVRMFLEDWDMTDLRKRFWDFSNELSGKQIVTPVA